jgi:predicted nucleic acid-binding protein
LAIAASVAGATGVQVGTIDALLAQLCIRHDLIMLTADQDFRRAADRSTLRVWNPA